MKKLRTAVVGLGWAGTVHARTLAALPGIDLVALADLDPTKHTLFPGVPTFTDLEAMLDLNLDYCVIATPSVTHEHYALTLAAAGVPALIEKPLAPSAPAAWRISDAFTRAGILAAVGHTERHQAPVAELGRRLRGGEFGDLWQLTTRRQGPYSGRILDVGVALDLLVHDVDLVAWAAGQPIESVTASTRVIAGPHEDTATATTVLHGGVLAHHHADCITPFKHRILQAHTASGVLTADTIAGTLTHHLNTVAPAAAGTFPGVCPGDARRIALPEQQAPFTVEHQLMRDALMGADPRGLVTLAEGVAAVAATEAVLTAAATGRATAVPTCRLALA
ncbi:Gfo/Idh/MocA family protein [Streptomyces mobaraensis]|uniref:Gfo/Idh/MocA family oxidoreductase n=1 Tax=Streptomyces mobaraensis TaxID=35621 RepID=A0A5N5W2T1_STRMB|nr:Gfo/Idh/MocA family oxidoreductase [Streptomyces mobaraensis]KAB7835575.1 Gfo/Idh/MocA family oxidoreductase [Streptomyces mobaraensis]